MAEWMNRKSFLLVMSFILTIFLFALATDANGGLRSTSLNSQTSSNTITNVPIYIDINSDEYAVTGLPASVALRLEGSSSLLLSTTGNGTYRVKTPNLTELGEGKHTITLEVTGLPTGVHGSVSPETVEVTIEKITTKEVPVVVKADASLVGNGYQVGEGTASPATVTVKAASSIVDQVEQVVANVSIPEGTKTDYTTTAQLQALDATGNPVAVKIDPERVQVRVPISSSQKTVPIVLTATGTSSRYSYLLNSTTKQVTILGAQSSLSQITAIPVAVDVSNITQSTKKTVTVPLPSGVNSVTPETIEVMITVVDNSLRATEDSTTQSVTTEEPSQTTKEQTTQAQ